MKSKTRHSAVPHEVFIHDDRTASHDLLSAEELEEALFEDDGQSSSAGPDFLTIFGIGLGGVSFLYLLQQIGFLPGDLSGFVTLLIILAGALILMSVTGMFSGGSSKRRKSKRKKSRKARSPSEQAWSPAPGSSYSISSASPPKKRLRRSSRSKAIMGVAGGIGEYFDVDPTILRIAMGLAVLATGGGFVLAYFLIGFFMPGPEDA